MKSYGIDNIDSNLNELEQHKENIKRKGFSVHENLLSPEECTFFIEKITEIYKKQEQQVGKDVLQKINELNVARMPFLDDIELSKLFLNPYILTVVQSILGEVFEINLQNAIINTPKLEHHQSSWHRDLPYQNWVISQPIAMNAFVCLTDFNPDTGATFFLPYSQKFTHFPSIENAENEKVQLNASKGSVVFFDSMVFHKAGYNSSDNNRIGINNMFSVPILKTQVENQHNYNDVEMDRFTDEEKQILGLKFKTPKSVLEYRNNKIKKG